MLGDLKKSPFDITYMAVASEFIGIETVKRALFILFFGENRRKSDS